MSSSLPVYIDSAASPSSTIALKDKILPSLLAVALGALMLYGAGFASTEALHNAAHDSRHSAGFPCH